MLNKFIVLIDFARDRCSALLIYILYLPLLILIKKQIFDLQFLLVFYAYKKNDYWINNSAKSQSSLIKFGSKKTINICKTIFFANFLMN